MRICVTGIQGFVGPHLRDCLRARGHEVIGIDRRGRGSDILNIDITDPEAVRQCIRDVAPEAIVHLAAISHVSFGNTEALYAINVMGTRNILDAAIRLGTMPRFLLISSSQVYGVVPTDQQPISERAPVRPVNHYGASKAAAEQIACAYHHEHSFPVAIARPFNHTGRGQDPSFVIPKIVAAAKEKRVTIELGNLDVVRDFLDVRDVVAAYAAMIDDFPDGGIYNIASGRGYYLTEVVRLIEETAGIALAITSQPTLMRSNEIRQAIGDSSAFRSRYRWQPSYELRDTLSWMLADSP